MIFQKSLVKSRIHTVKQHKNLRIFRKPQTDKIEKKM